MARHNETGKWGERIASDYLKEVGYSILHENWRMGHLEIDIVARKDDELVFAEVKTRSDRDSDPLDAIDKRKIANMVRAADAYMKHENLPFEARFDIFAISGTPDEYEFEHIPDAFYPPLKTY
ncbi:MAG: YraN family protein [Bacteroidales bacterium]|nr:YraN family protein [Bacteroidales bacterium]